MDLAEFDVGFDGAQVAALVTQFAEVAGALRASDNDGIDPERLVQVAATTVPHAVSCGLTLIRARQRPRTLACTDQLTQAVDDLQYATGEGPCLAASQGDTITVVDDLAVDPRWPAFATACAADTGVRSVVSVGLALSGADRAALNLYALTRDAFDDVDVATASILGPYAALATEGALRREDAAQFAAALSTSRQIGRAVGIVMARELVTEQEAFAMIQAASQRLNRKLRDVAAEVEFTGSLPRGSSQHSSR